MTTQVGALEVCWVGGGVYLAHGADALLLDAPPGVAQRLGSDRLARIRAIATTSGRLESIGGLVDLLGALEPHRTSVQPLNLHLPVGEERAELLAGAWVRGWPDRYPLSIDSDMPGLSFDEGPFAVHTVRVRHAEPVWGTSPRVEGAVGVALQVVCGGARVAWVPGAAPGPAARRACEGMDLAIVEVGVTRWPPSSERLRLDVVGALEAASGAGSTWLVGDDGQLAGDAA